ncbi:chain length determinant protein tyrosine kinase EpsG [uncultured Oxalicibacterium sp.]|uniref:chain length determinant protein tyrosine kinase EpsG n=1 Tax=uncultured Oxalicibacterium sp. TaxID=1168540 RepID=UPI0025DC64D4|nr:chain length determinant protein tyrosine kinase EpsG [uncultured Oxalicibacterium sp.]
MNQLFNPTAFRDPNVRDAGVAKPDTNIGSILLDLGKLSPSDAERVIKLQKEKGMRFGEAAQALGLVTESDIEQVLAHQFDYPYLRPGQGGFSTDLVAAYRPFSAQVEMLRGIRSQLMLRWFANRRKALVIAAVEEDAGVSLLAANLSIVFSQLGEKTLLVDANLRNPQQQRIFNLTGKHGLSDVLVERADLQSINKIEPFIDLSLLTAGTIPPNPQELLSRPAFARVNQHVEHDFDVILYEVSAFSTGADALAVGAQVGGVLLVARKNKTRVAQLNAAAEQFGRFGADVIGSVLLED